MFRRLLRLPETINMNKLIAVMLIAFIFQSVNAQLHHSNAFIAGDFADPSIIKANGMYYATGTSSEWAPHYPIYSSTDLTQWKQTGYVFDKAPEWISGSFWAPEYYFHNDTYFVYYTARRKADGISCIGVATSKYPDKGFTDHGVIVDFGKEAIDAFVYNDKGQLYITFKAYGLDDRPIEILGSKLSADGLKMEGDVFSLLRDDKRMGMEGQSILKESGYYYLFYSAGNCCGSGCSYNVRVARSKNFKGPYEDYKVNPILQSFGTWKCAGHGTFVKNDNGKYVYMFHAYHQQTNVFTGRQGMLANLNWKDRNAWPTFTAIDAGDSFSADIKETFDADKIGVYWQWDFRHAVPNISQAKGLLHLSGAVAEKNKTGIALTVRPVSTAFDMETTVFNISAALKGLVLYGDANAAIGIGVTENNVQYWMVKDGQRIILAEKMVYNEFPVTLKFVLNNDLTCAVYCRQLSSGWQQLKENINIKLDFLPQWDRSPRAGLHFLGKENEEGVFSEFKLINRW
jgi:beta-xylosidase